MTSFWEAGSTIIVVHIIALPAAYRQCRIAALMQGLKFHRAPMCPPRCDFPVPSVLSAFTSAIPESHNLGVQVLEATPLESLESDVSRRRASPCLPGDVGNNG